MTVCIGGGSVRGTRLNGGSSGGGGIGGGGGGGGDGGADDDASGLYKDRFVARAYTTLYWLDQQYTRPSFIIIIIHNDNNNYYICIGIW